MNKTGLVQIYCGDGKGKTATAIGTTVQVIGWEYRVLVVKLLKTDDPEGVIGLSHVPGTTVLPYGQNFGFSWNTIQVQRKAAALYYDYYLLSVRNMALGADRGEPYDTLMLDGATGACNLGLMDGTGLVKVLKEKPVALEVILTGHCPSEALWDQANYTTEMIVRHHSYGRGVGVREGIEYQKMNIREYILTP